MGPGCFQVTMPTVGLGSAPSTGSPLSCRRAVPHKDSSSVFIGPCPSPATGEGWWLALAATRVIFGLTGQFVIAKPS